MIEKDTVRLLRECDAGVKMGVDSIDDVRNEVCNQDMKNILVKCKKDHEALAKEIEGALNRFSDDGKEPNPIAETMAKMKTEFKMRMKHCDKTIASLMTDGCNMGVKSLARYLNEYAAADEDSKNITKRLIALEEKLAQDLRAYL